MSLQMNLVKMAEVLIFNIPIWLNNSWLFNNTLGKNMDGQCYLQIK